MFWCVVRNLELYNVLMIKAKIGRPTKYKPELINKVYNYLKMKKEDNGLPTTEGLASFLEINTDTLWEWGKKYKSFSEAIKKLKEEQRSMLQELSLKNKWNPTMGIFLLKNNHGFTDHRNVDVTSKGEKIEGFVFTIEEKSNDS